MGKQFIFLAQHLILKVIYNYHHNRKSWNADSDWFRWSEGEGMLWGNKDSEVTDQLSLCAETSSPENQKYSFCMYV